MQHEARLTPRDMATLYYGFNEVEREGATLTEWLHGKGQRNCPYPDEARPCKRCRDTRQALERIMRDAYGPA